MCRPPIVRIERVCDPERPDQRKRITVAFSDGTVVQHIADERGGHVTRVYGAGDETYRCSTRGELPETRSLEDAVQVWIGRFDRPRNATPTISD